MTLHVALGIAAGLVSALLFAAVGAGSLPAVMLMYLAPLPILIVALGWHHLVGLLALAVGAIAVSAFIRPSTGVAFALGPALSAWFLAYLALLVRPSPSSNDNGPARWFPVGYLLLWLGIAGALIGVSTLAAATSGDYDKYKQALEFAASSLIRREAGMGRAGPLPQTLGLPGRDFVAMMVVLAPAMLGAMLSLILTVNLWLAAKVVAISGRLARPWPDISSARMPMVAVAALVAALIMSRSDGFTGVTAMALTGGLAMAFALQGLALMHFVSSGRPGRAVMLTIAYGLTGILGYIFLPAFALLGMADSLFSLRRAFGTPTPPPPSSGPSN